MHEIGPLWSKTKTEFNSRPVSLWKTLFSQWSYLYEAIVLSAGDRDFSGAVPVLKWIDLETMTCSQMSATFTESEKYFAFTT